jgi:catechol 2,3-dioxygenase-like lactoylglutathione lyase family enzyme
MRMELFEGWLDRYERGVIDRRAFLAGAAAVFQASVTEAAPRPGIVTPAGVHHVELKTVDLAGTTAFYEALLGPATVANERATIALEPGGGRGSLRISRGPIPRVDHFAIRVPGMSARDPKAMRARLEKRGLKVRQVEAALYIKGPDDLEVELVAPSAKS